MTQTKTKKALLMSVLSMVLCVAMLVGMTFAWFTDTASTSVNKIVSGKLDVALEMKDNAGNWVNAEKETLQFKVNGKIPEKKADGTYETILWEPGCTYELPELRVVNNGNLALKYKIQITGIKGDAELNDVITWTINNADMSTEYTLTPEQKHSENITISGHMQESAGNHYMNMSIEGITITVYATQMQHESDSKDNTYDKNAPLPETKSASDAASIAAAVADVATEGSKNVAVTITKDMDKTSGIKTAKGNTLSMNLNGKTVGVSYGQGSTNTTTNGMQLLQGSTVNLKNGTYKANHGEDKDHNIAILIQNYSNLTVENCTLDMREANDTAGNSKGTSYALSTNCGKVVIKGKTDIYSRSGEYALDVMHWENASYKEEGTSVVFEDSMTGTVDGKIDVYCYRGSAVVKPVDDGGATLVIKGGTFRNSGLSLDEFKAFVPTGYTVTTNADGSFTVSK